MLSVSRIISWLYLLAFFFLPFYAKIRVADELFYVLVTALGLADCVINRRWKAYAGLWIMFGIFALYLVYSLIIHSNTVVSILYDIFLEAKPFAVFFIGMAVAPHFTPLEKAVGRWLSLWAAFIVIGFGVMGYVMYWSFVDMFFGHIAGLGQVAFVAGITYLFCSVRDDGTLSRKDLLVMMSIFTTGLLGTRAKYFGIYVIILFLFFLYRPGMLRRISLSTLSIIGGLLFVVMLVAWKKISYYFIGGGMAALAADASADFEVFARPILYYVGALILIDYFPFGSGLASFATYASSGGEPSAYSHTYAEFGIDKFWGLSESYPNFICDAFYPSLAQFGFVGVALFIYFFVYCCRFLKRMIRFNPVKYKYHFIIGTLIISFLLIECVAATTFTNAFGMQTLMLLGFICGEGKGLPKVKEQEIQTS